jgi:hypothetical protein
MTKIITVQPLAGAENYVTEMTDHLYNTMEGYSEVMRGETLLGYLQQQGRIKVRCRVQVHEGEPGAIGRKILDVEASL